MCMTKIIIYWFYKWQLVRYIHLLYYQHELAIGLHISPPPCGEGNGNPLQHSYLENPMDGGAW